MKHSNISRRLRAGLVTTVAICMLGSCSVIRVIQVDSPTANRAGTGQEYGHHTTIHSSAWVSKNNKKINCQCANGMSRFKVTTKPGDFVVGFLTAGFVVKQHIDWDCAQRKGSSDIE